MRLIEAGPYISSGLVDVVSTTVEASSAVTPRGETESASHEQWQRWIDHTLIEWGRNPSRLSDEGVEPPSGETILLAIQLAQAMKRAGSPPPTSVVPDANGGIVFERRRNNLSEVLHVWDDGKVEYQCFHGTDLIKRLSF